MSHDTPPDDPGTDAGAQSDDDRGLPKVTRRMALGLLGLGVLAGGETTAVQGDVGGGPDSDELAHVLRPTYEGPESELPAPGVEGRRFTVTDTGGTYPQWSEQRDTGSAWEPINFGAGSVNTDKQLGPHGVIAYYYDDDADEHIYESFETTAAGIQNAIDALPLQDNQYAESGARTGGDVYIFSKEGEHAYDGPIQIDKKGTYQGLGRWTELANTQTSDPTILVDASDGTPDDVYIRDLWIDGNSAPAILSRHKETHLQNLNIESGPNGEPAIDLEGDRSTAHDIEQKASGMRMSGDEGYFHSWLINKELGQPIVIPFDVQGDYNSFHNCHGWPYEGSGSGTNRYGVRIAGDRNEFVGSAGTTPEDLSGRITQAVRIVGNWNYFSGHIWKAEGGVRITGSENYVEAQVSDVNTLVSFSGNNNVVNLAGNLDAPISWGGSRNVVNGRSINSGNPASTGAWNGEAAFAARVGVTVIDTSASSPLPRYEAQPDGSGGYEWVEASVTAA